MNVVLFGASGMVGSALLLECLDSPFVDSVLLVGRSTSGVEHEKLRELVHRDFLDFGPIADRLTGLDACFWCLGISAAGLKEVAYNRVTYEYTTAAARSLLERSPGIHFCLVSGFGADSSMKSEAMWKRIKGKTENAILGMGFERATVFRPAYIQPRKGVRSKTRSYRLLYRAVGPLYPILRRVFPSSVTTSDTLARAMLRVARTGAPKLVLHTPEINHLGIGIG